MMDVLKISPESCILKDIYRIISYDAMSFCHFVNENISFFWATEVVIFVQYQIKFGSSWIPLRPDFEVGWRKYKLQALIMLYLKSVFVYPIHKSIYLENFMFQRDNSYLIVVRVKPLSGY